MAVLLARIQRIIPVIILFAVIAGIIYLVVKFRHSPARAKEVLIKIFTVLMIIVSVFFGLVTLYAWYESHDGVFDLSVSFLIVGLIGLAITRWCNHIFLKHNPHFRHKRNANAKTKRRFPWGRG